MVLICNLGKSKSLTHQLSSLEIDAIVGRSARKLNINAIISGLLIFACYGRFKYTVLIII